MNPCPIVRESKERNLILSTLTVVLLLNSLWVPDLLPLRVDRGELERRHGRNSLHNSLPDEYGNSGLPSRWTNTCSSFFSVSSRRLSVDHFKVRVETQTTEDGEAGRWGRLGKTKDRRQGSRRRWTQTGENVERKI